MLTRTYCKMLTQQDQQDDIPVVPAENEADFRCWLNLIGKFEALKGAQLIRETLGRGVTQKLNRSRWINLVKGNF